MNRSRSFLLGALAYALVTFPLAYSWHLVFFADVYRHLRFTTLPEPNVPVGFLTIVFQGFLLSALYARVRRAGRPLRDGLTFAALVGAFLWSAATVAHAAKHDVVEPLTFIGMEAGYFAINFAAYGLLLGLVWAERVAPKSA